MVLFHVVGIYAIARGLANSTIQLLKGNIKANVVQEEVKNDLPPPPPPPDFKPPPVVAIQQEVTVDLAQAPPPTTTTAITNTPPPPKIEAAPPPPPPPPPTPPVATTSHALNADEYPPISYRLQETGTVGIKYLVQTDGTVGECMVTKPSGKPRLDDAACAAVKKYWKFKPATQNGKPVGYSLTADFIFQLK